MVRLVEVVIAIPVFTPSIIKLMTLIATEFDISMAVEDVHAVPKQVMRLKFPFRVIFVLFWILMQGYVELKGNDCVSSICAFVSPFKLKHSEIRTVHKIVRMTEVVMNNPQAI